jgi:site-specific DNA-cytosine methylase
MGKKKSTKAIEPNGSKQENKVKWAAVVPLIGGMSIGNYEATGNKPEFILSYPEFMSNDQHIRNYWPDVPYSLIDSKTNELLPDEIQEEKQCYKCHKEELRKKFEGVDFVTSIPPCAGLSMMNASNKAGSSGARGSDAKQNEWMYKSTHFILENIRPRVLFGENAPGLYTKTGAGVVENLKKIAEQYNYSFSVYKTNTIYHGIPQKRERTFYFLWDSESAPIFNEYRREHVTLEQYLKTVPVNAPQQDIFPSFSSVKNNPFVMFLKEKEGENWREVALQYKTATNWLVSNKHLDNMLDWLETDYLIGEEKYDKVREKTAKYLRHVKEKVGMGMGWWDGTPHFFGETINAVIGRTILTTVHPTEERGLNMREIMHLMGLPHDFEITNVNHYNHIAQNVPTCTARDMTYEVMKFLKGDLVSSEQKFIKQTNSQKRIDTPISAKQLF